MFAYYIQNIYDKIRISEHIVNILLKLRQLYYTKNFKIIRNAELCGSEPLGARTQNVLPRPKSSRSNKNLCE